MTVNFRRADLDARARKVANRYIGDRAREIFPLKKLRPSFAAPFEVASVSLIVYLDSVEVYVASFDVLRANKIESSLQG